MRPRASLRRRCRRCSTARFARCAMLPPAAPAPPTRSASGTLCDDDAGDGAVRGVGGADRRTGSSGWPSDQLECSERLEPIIGGDALPLTLMGLPRAASRSAWTSADALPVPPPVAAATVATAVRGRRSGREAAPLIGGEAGVRRRLRPAARRGCVLLTPLSLLLLLPLSLPALSAPTRALACACSQRDTCSPAATTAGCRHKSCSAPSCARKHSCVRRGQVSVGAHQRSID